jgi:hypothetical protein
VIVKMCRSTGVAAWSRETGAAAIAPAAKSASIAARFPNPMSAS